MDANYLITGATGLIGSHTLYELLNTQLSSNSDAKFFLLVRPSKHLSAIARVEKLLNWVEIPDYLKKYSFEQLWSKIKVIEGSLNDLKLANQLSTINNENTIVIHSAASTNLFQNDEAEKDVLSNNFYGTKSLALAMSRCQQFVFVSTAFSFGNQAKRITDEHQLLDEKVFRNPYEKHKNRIENWLTKFFCKKLKIVRPSIVCGRLLDTPKYVTTKFDVIYGWAKFFYKLKDIANATGVRIQLANFNDINIIPVDYFVKVMLNFITNTEHQCLNIVNKKEVFASKLFASILEQVGVENYTFVSGIPQTPNQIEGVFYKNVHVVFGPYTSGQNIMFDTNLLSHYDQEIDQFDILEKLQELFIFAKERGFSDGLEQYNVLAQIAV